jgi:hypothetical protein
MISLVCAFLVVGFMNGCSGDEDDQPPPPPKALEDRLLHAYATLERAANDLPDAQLPRSRTLPIEVVEAGEEISPPRFPRKDLELIEYFADRGITFSVATLDEDTDRASVLEAIATYRDDPRSITLILPADLQAGSAVEILAAGGTFAAGSATGEVYCVDDPKSGVEACS